MGRVVLYCKQCDRFALVKFPDPIDVLDVLTLNGVTRFLSNHNRDVVIEVVQQN
jgi:hypothetical protein